MATWEPMAAWARLQGCKDQGLHFALGAAIGHIDHCRWEYLNEMYISVVVCSPELSLNPATRSPYLCFSIYKIGVFLIPLLKYRPFCAMKVKGNSFTNYLKCCGAKMKQLEGYLGTKMGEGQRTERKGEEELTTSSSVLQKAAGSGKPWEYIISKFILLMWKMNVSGFYSIKQ